MAGFVGYTQLLLSKVSVQAPDMQQAIQLLSRGNPGRPIFFSVLSSFFCLLSMLLMVLNFLKPSEMLLQRVAATAGPLLVWQSA